MGSRSGDGAAVAAVVLVSWLCFAAAGVGAIGANWGTQASHPLPPETVVRLLKDNGFQKVKLFDAEEGTMNALKKSGLEVMVGIPNDMLAMMATSMKDAEKWVDKNVSSYLNDGVSIRQEKESFVAIHSLKQREHMLSPSALRSFCSAIGLGHQERSRLPAPGDADELSVIEGQIAWMVHIIAAIVKVRQVTGASQETQELIDAELSARVLQLISMTDTGAHAQLYPVASLGMKPAVTEMPTEKNKAVDPVEFLCFFEIRGCHSYLL